MPETGDKANKTQSPHAEEGPRKRAKTSPSAVVTEVKDDGADDTSKRVRGRPRLDTKDQTAADVRLSSA